MGDVLGADRAAFEELEAGLVQGYVEDKFSSEDLRGTLYLNASCPLVRQLAEAPPAPPALASVLTLLYQMARLFCGRMLSTEDVSLAFRETVQALDGLLKP